VGPTQSEVLDSIAFTLDEHLAPEITSELGRSMVLTIRYLLHQTAARIEHEGEVLWEQALDLRRTLAEVAALVDDELGATITARLEQLRRPEAAYPSLAALDEETAALRGIVDLVIVELDRPSAPGPHDGVPRVLLRGCLRRQLEAEGHWMLTGYAAPRR